MPGAPVPALEDDRNDVLTLDVRDLRDVPKTVTLVRQSARSD
jgi:hypothetical protein